MLKVIVLVTCLLVLDYRRRSLRRQYLELRQRHLAFIRSAGVYMRPPKPSLQGTNPPQQPQGEQPLSPEDRQRLMRLLGEIPITLRLRFPHRTIGVLFIGFCLFGLFVAYRTGKLGVFESGLLFFAIIQSVRVALGLLYRISLNDGVISRRAFGQPPVSIAIADVTSIVEPASDLTTLATSNEPFPGFTVNGRSASGASKTISVSTKYFVAQDVRWLMRTIQAARPDLVPTMGESALIREISKLADERTRRVVLGGLFGKYNAMLNPDVAALERELTQLRDRLLAEARARGFEVPENK